MVDGIIAFSGNSRGEMVKWAYMGSSTFPAISHGYQEETIEEKARWFQSLSLQERMDLFCEYTDLILELNPKIMEEKDAEPIAGRVLVLRGV
jgi:hypothetical protein